MLKSAANPELSPLTAISPLDGRYWNRVNELSEFFSEMALIKIRVEVECLYVIALSKVGVVRKLTKKEVEMLTNLGPQMTMAQVQRVKEIEDTTRHDVKAVEKAIRELVAGTSLMDVTELIHFGLTSEDINNISYRLLVGRARAEVMVPIVSAVISSLAELATQTESMPMLARTHGQAAVPTTLGKEMANLAMRVELQKRKLATATLTGKVNGAVGNYNALALAVPAVDWIMFSQDFIHSLGLEPNLFTTQINPYEDLIELFQIFQRLNGILIDLDQDLWRYISDNWFIQQIKKGEVGSSTMPQKVNPIDFENSEGNLQIANSLFEGMGRKLAVSRLQRDLSDSTTIRNIGVAFGYSLLAYKSTLSGLSRVKPNPEVIADLLDENWTILAEGVQTVLRLAGVADPYSLLASLSKGQKVSRTEWKNWLDQLPVAAEVRKQLSTLVPEAYIGEAKKLTEMVLKELGSSI